MNAPRILAIGLPLLLAACGNEQTGPTRQSGPGTATVALVTPNTDDGAVLITLTGPGLSNAQPASSAYLLYSRAVNADELRAIVVGDLGATVLFTVHVDDVSRIAEYTGTLVDVASRSYVERGSMAGYAVFLAVQH